MMVFLLSFTEIKSCINYQSDIRLQEIHRTKELMKEDIVRQLTEIVLFS